MFTFLEKEQYVVQDTEITNNHNTSTIVTTSEVPHSITQTESIIKQLKTLNLTPVSIDQIEYIILLFVERSYNLMVSKYGIL